MLFCRTSSLWVSPSRLAVTIWSPWRKEIALWPKLRTHAEASTLTRISLSPTARRTWLRNWTQRRSPRFSPRNSPWHSDLVNVATSLNVRAGAKSGWNCCWVGKQCFIESICFGGLLLSGIRADHFKLTHSGAKLESSLCFFFWSFCCPSQSGVSVNREGQASWNVMFFYCCHNPLNSTKKCLLFR